MEDTQKMVATHFLNFFPALFLLRISGSSIIKCPPVTNFALHCVFAAEIKCVTLNQKIKSIWSIDDLTNCMPPCRSSEIIFCSSLRL